ncbi:MAG: hypothetical protein HN347_13005 [Bacteroidetes bacterium]|jgi:hypothetical protein|nr:hypothetical protein [Bacteroidota bacterium]
MKKITIYIFAILLLSSCESQENKNSRLTLDKYARKMNSIAEDIVSSREEEGSQSRMTLNSFYERYTSKCEDFNNDLDFESISEKYSPSREKLVSLSREYYKYLNVRKSAIINMSTAMSAYESAIDYEKDYNEYLAKISSSTYSSDYYVERATNSISKKYDKTIEFIQNQSSYLIHLEDMDSLLIFIDSISYNYNVEIANSKLIEEIRMPKIMNDTINDWLITSKDYIEKLEI